MYLKSRTKLLFVHLEVVPVVPPESLSKPEHVGEIGEIASKSPHRAEGKLDVVVVGDAAVKGVPAHEDHLADVDLTPTWK